MDIEKLAEKGLWPLLPDGNTDGYTPTGRV